MKFDGVSESSSGYDVDLDSEHEHRKAEHKHEEMPEIETARTKRMNRLIHDFTYNLIARSHSVILPGYFVTNCHHAGLVGFDFDKMQGDVSV